MIYLIEGIDLFSGVHKCVIKDVIEYQTSAGKIKKYVQWGVEEWLYVDMLKYSDLIENFWIQTNFYYWI